MIRTVSTTWQSSASGTPNKVIYSSRYPMADFASSDVSTRIFGLESDELRAFLRTEGAASSGSENNRPAGSLVSSKETKRSSGQRSQLLRAKMTGAGNY